MARRSGFTTLTLMAGLLTITPFAGAQQAVGAGIPNASIIRHAVTAGIRTDRLSRRELRIWRKIERIVFARDTNGQSRHPTLERLWREVEWSGHSIFIEIPSGAAVSMAGKFVVERIDPEGKNHILSIHLYLSGINIASTGEGGRRTDGFIPFEKLDREKRYAEVLGHELAHAVLTIQDPHYAALVQEQRRLEAELAARSHAVGRVVIDGESELRMRRLDSLAKAVEAPANAVEIEVWRELARISSRNREGHAIGDPALL
jgi:hypothetical protein